MSSHQDPVAISGRGEVAGVALHKSESERENGRGQRSVIGQHHHHHHQQQRFHLLGENEFRFNQPQQQHHHQQQVTASKEQQTNSIESTLLQQQFQFQFQHQQQQQQQSHHNQGQYSTLLGGQNGQSNSIECSTFEEDLSSYWSDSTLSNCDKANYESLESSKTRRAKSGPNSSRLPKTATNRNELKTVRGNNDDDDDDDNNNQTANGGSTNSNIGVGMKRKRHMANERERERTKSLNEALEILRNRLPVPEAEKRSKIQTLRTAKEYIEFLARLRRTAQESAECDSSSQELSQYQNKSSTSSSFALSSTTKNPHSQRPTTGNNNNIDPTNPLPDSPLTYKFYKFRHSQKLK